MLASGKSRALAEAAIVAARKGKTVVFATVDQRRKVAELARQFPQGTLFEVVSFWGVRPWLPRSR